MTTAHLGFLASTELSNGTIHKDERLVRTGYFRMKDAVSAYPPFKLFSSGYTKSGVPARLRAVSNRGRRDVEELGLVLRRGG